MTIDILMQMANSAADCFKQARDHAKESGKTIYIYGAGIKFYPSFERPDDMNIEAFVHPDGSYTADKGFIGLVKAADPCFDNETQP